MLRDLITRGKPESVMRWLILFSYIFAIGVVIFVWMIISFIKSELQDIPAGLFALVSAIISVVTAGKWLEKREEIRENLESKEACHDSSDK